MASADVDLLLGRCGSRRANDDWVAGNNSPAEAEEGGMRDNGQLFGTPTERDYVLIQIEFPFLLIFEQHVRGGWSSYW